MLENALSVVARFLVAGLVLAAGAATVGGCPSEAEPDALFLKVTSDPATSGDRIDSLRITMTDGTSRLPAELGDPMWNPQLGEALDPSKRAVYIQIDYEGASLTAGPVTARIVGNAAGKAVAVWEGPIQLASTSVVVAHLRAITDACDVDGDGFFDCSVVGCCEGGDSVFADCEPNAADANPWGVEVACEPCDDTVDQDCSGGDQPCVDADGDGVADCAEVDCGQGDPYVAPGLPELCDGKDNDCDGDTDEGFAWNTLAVGAACSEGICEDGTVVCAEDGESATCDSLVDAEPEDTCFDDLDNDCDGSTDENCEASDIDGDGVTTPEDCDDHDAGFFPGAPEPCCPASLAAGEDPLAPSPEVDAACDADCDGEVAFCSPDDADGDGLSPPEDCDDTNPAIYPGAPEKCGDGIDQDCFAGDLPCSLVEVDGDGDGYGADVDCVDSDPNVHPAAPELCDGKDNDCDTLVDEGNPGGGAVCGSEVGECAPGVLVCVHSEGAVEVGCEDDIEPTGEVCDGKDNDCDGKTDNGLSWQGIPIGGACDGTGACGAGVVECSPTGGAPTCSTNPDGSSSEATDEVCDTLDNDCDGQTNEGVDDLAASTCKQLGVCGKPGAVVVATCTPGGSWNCDYAGVPGYAAAEVACDGVDEDCDGVVDDEFGVGQGCDGDDADQCDNGTVTCNADQTSTFCLESGDSLERCDGKDNDCDGQTDEGFVLGAKCDGSDVDSCENGVTVCSADGTTTVCGAESPSGIVETCDGVDNDCDGVSDEIFTDLEKPCDGPDSDSCPNGVYVCNAAGDGVVCGAETQTDIVEICDGLDNDCDGDTDEDWPTLGQACDGPDSDECELGVLVCNGSQDGVVCGTETQTDIVEVCDNQDNDCDGQTDEALTADGTDGVCDPDGVCGDNPLQVTAVCNAGTWNCDYSAVPDWVAAETDPAQCDGLDNDCDGQTDEGYANQDGDSLANCVDPDIDGDGVDDDVNGMGTGTTCSGGDATGCDDNCPYQQNASQADMDDDAIGDTCDPDRDGDGINQSTGDPPCTGGATTGCSDNCPNVANADQADANGNGIGDLCDVGCDPGVSVCDEDGRTLRTCNAQGTAFDPALTVVCGYVCADGSCRYASNVPDATMEACDDPGVAFEPPDGATVLYSATAITCDPDCGGGVTSIPVSGGLSTEVTDEPAHVCVSSMIVTVNTDIYPHPTLPPSKPLAFLVDGSVTFNGWVRFHGQSAGSSSGGAGGPGGGDGADQCVVTGCTGATGGGAGGGSGGQGGTGNYDAGGGGGAGYGGVGGDGGTAQEGAGGAGGPTYGSPALEPLLGGSGGAGGGDGSGGTDPGPGGGGGGALQITARGQIELQNIAWLYCDGGSGRDASGRMGAGGGGSGGAILLEAPTMTFGTDVELRVDGGDGGDGAAGSGGSGASTQLDGGDGAGSTAATLGGAGGGGGAGRVRLNAMSGATCDYAFPVQACTIGELKTSE